MRIVLVVLLLLAAGSAAAAPQTLTLDASRVAELDRLPVGGRVAIEHFPDGFGGEAKLNFRRMEVYAPDARLVAVDASGERDVARSRRIHLLGATGAGDVRASLSFDPGLANVSGVGTAPSGPFAIRAERDGAGLRLRAMSVTETLPAGVVPDIVAGDDGLPSGRPAPSALELKLAPAPAGTLHVARLAFDTDNEFMSERFGNSTSAATDWIADLVASMNVMYERDLDVVLQQGTTILRTTTDPYAQSNTPADQADLQEFGSYWAAHYGNVSRAFALLLSGKSSSPNSASGIAWIYSYCEEQSSGGSYSVNQIFTNSGIDVFYSALIVGHELGHNFGAYHTHCTNASTGAAPTPTNTIDQCYSGESNCYSGVTSCPASGPGAPAGTVMSYCNIRGCGPNGQNVLQFHPTQVTTLSALIAQNTPSCLSSVIDQIFRNGFD